MISLRSSLFSFLLFFIALNEPNFQLFVKGEKPFQKSKDKWLFYRRFSVFLLFNVVCHLSLKPQKKLRLVHRRSPKITKIVKHWLKNAWDR